ncbi:hypothetical protein KM043_002119 [Ampulex compressa]|nr:hypothetical protein KM043_002119 [Ampulex compressa]
MYKESAAGRTGAELGERIDRTTASRARLRSSSAKKILAIKRKLNNQANLRSETSIEKNCWNRPPSRMAARFFIDDGYCGFVAASRLRLYVSVVLVDGRHVVRVLKKQGQRACRSFS